MEKIDFVILWVDDQDPVWKKEKEYYQGEKNDKTTSDNRFRDWNTLKYWFRGVEKFAPWVHQIFFITYGHIPDWLNVNHPKLKIINHKDFIDEKYLPTFNSNVIEINLNKIEELSEHFVEFNDDMFLIKDTLPSDFFEKGLPKDEFVETIIMGNGNNDQYIHTLINNLNIINHNFIKSTVIKNNPFKHFHYRYGIKNFQTMSLLFWDKFSGFTNPHLPISHLKSTFDEVWEKEKAALLATCQNKFRMNNDVSHWVFRYWNLCKYRFSPRRTKKFGKYFDIDNISYRMICNHIEQQHSKVVCINDSSMWYDFEKIQPAIVQSFDKILPEPSSFEI